MDNLSILIVIAFVVLIGIAIWQKPIGSENTVRIIVLLAVIFASLLLVIEKTVLQEKVAPIWGLLGAIAGYMARGFGGKGNGADKPSADSKAK